MLTSARRVVSVRFGFPALVDFLIVSDPDLSRLRLALRAVLSTGLCAAVLASLSASLGSPAVSTMLGSFLALMSSVFVRDPRVKEQRATHLFLLGSALPAVALAVALSEHPFLSGIAFLGIVFVAVFVRRFGPRATALGMIGFIAYFDASYFHAPLAELPWLLAAATLGILISGFVRFTLVRETPRALLRAALEALVHQTRRIEAVATLALEVPADYERYRPRVRAELARLNEIALTIDEHLKQAPADRRVALRLAVLDVELAAARLGRRLRESLIDHSREAPNPALAFPLAVAALERTRRDWLAALAGRSEPSAAAELPGGPLSSRAPVAGQRSVHPSTRQALQAFVACGLAMLGGHWVSPNRWYWAVLTAFVVFNQVHTAFDTVVRAWHRVVGTLGGVLAGAVLSHYVASDRTLALVVLFVGIFCGFYLLRVSYAWMVFWLSSVLVLLYGLLGHDTHGLLELRLFETLVGAACGVFAALVVLPVHATLRVEGLLASLLRRLEAYLEAAFVARGSFDDVFERARRVDAALHEFREAAEPLTNNVLPTGRRLDQVVEAAALVVMVARHAVYDSRSPLSEPPLSEDAASLAEAAARVLDHVHRLSSELTSGAGAGETLPLIAAQMAGAPMPPLFERVEQALSSLDLAVRAWHKS